MKLESSYQSNITYYQNKINDYNREARKPEKEQSLTFKMINVAQYQIQLEYYQKKEKKRLQKLALVKACETTCNQLKPEASKTKRSFSSDINTASSKLAKFKGKQMIKGKSGKKLEQSVTTIRNSVNTIEFNGQSFN